MTDTILGLSETGFVALATVVLAGMFGVMVEVVRRDNRRTRHENHSQHAAGRDTLEKVAGKLDVVHGDVIAVRGDVAKIRETAAVHEDRIGRLEGPPKLSVVDWHEPYDDDGSVS